MSTSYDGSLLDHLAEFVIYLSTASSLWFSLDSSYDHEFDLSQWLGMSPQAYKYLLLVANLAHFLLPAVVIVRHCAAINTLIAGYLCCQLLTTSLRCSWHQPQPALCFSCCWLVVVLLSTVAACYLSSHAVMGLTHSCCRLLSPPIVDRCTQVVLSPATTHLCCSCHWLVVLVLLSAACICHCMRLCVNTLVAGCFQC